MKYTFNSKSAHSMRRDAVIIVPNEVAENQKEFDGKTFPILRPTIGRDGGYVRGRGMLMGDEYGLHTTSTGDMVVKIIG